MTAHNDLPSDCEPDNVVPMPAKPTARVLCIGSFSPGWDRERKARNAQQQTALDLANAFRSSDPAGLMFPPALANEIRALKREGK